MSREAKKLLIVLLAIDFLFIAIHLAYSLPRYTFNSLLQIDVDGGYAETYEYVKEATVALLLALVALRKRSLHLAAWSLLFLFSLVDDALQFHEALGKLVDGWIVRVVPESCVTKSFSEVFVMGGFGTVFLGFIVLTYRGAVAEVRRYGRHLLVLFALLAFFGVFGDLVQGCTTQRIARHALALFEDGGEMLALTILLVYSWVLLKNTTKPSTETAS